MGLLQRILKPLTGQASAIATTREPGWILRSIGGGTRSGVHISEATALSITAVYACVRIIAGPIGQLPCEVLRREGKKRVPATEHPAYWMLKRRPNPWMTAYKQRRLHVAHELLWGNGYAVIVRNGRGQAMELWPLLPEVTRPRVDDGRLVYDTVDQDGKARTIQAEDVVHISSISHDGIVGLSRIALHREALGLARVTEEFGASWFGQGSRSGGLLQLPAEVSEDARKKIEEQWRQTEAGLDNAHRVRLLPAGAVYTPLSIPPEDAQFLQTREFQIAEIARMYGVPLHMLESHQKSTSWGSGIEQMSLGFVRYTLADHIEGYEQELENKLFTEEEREKYTVKFNLNGLLRGDAKARAEYYGLGIRDGWLTVEEIRELEDLGPMDDGDLRDSRPRIVPGRAPLQQGDGSEEDDE